MKKGTTDHGAHGAHMTLTRNAHVLAKAHGHRITLNVKKASGETVFTAP